MRPSRTKFAILGILASGPKSGYDIRKAIESSIGYFWQESYGQLYPVLKVLEKEKCVTRKSVEQQKKPDAKIYTITDTGLRELRNWLAEPVRKPPLREEVLLKLFFGSHANPEDLIAMLRKEQEEASELSRILTEIQSNLASCYEPRDILFSEITLDYGIQYMKMQMHWAKRSMDKIKNRGRGK